MRSFFFIATLLVISSTFIFAQSRKSVEKFVRSQLERYPEIRLQDIYKSCYQDFMGSEHLILNRESVHKYLLKEMSEMDENILVLLPFEKCGLKGNYLRVDLNWVKSGEIGADELTDCFVESANYVKKHSLQDWKKYWTKIEKIIDDMNLNLHDYEKDKQFVKTLFDNGQYACSHSVGYRESYHPHYRIVSKKVLKKHKIKYRENSVINIVE